MVKRTSIFAVLILAGVVGPTMAQQTGPASNLQNEADKGIKTENSGASGYVGEQEKSGSAVHPPGPPHRTDMSGATTTAPSAQNSGAGIQRRARQQERACPRKGNRWLSLSEPAAGTGSAERQGPAWQQERTSCEAVKRLAAARGRGRKTRPSRGRGEKLSDGARAGSCGYAWPRWRHGRCRQ